MAERWRIVRADLRGADLRELVGDGYHAVLCDPPYGLAPDGRARTWDDDDVAARGFMGKAWDGAVPGATFWRGVLRCLRPGAHLLAFGGTRTYHRLACAVEDAGFEVRDMLAWLYGSGFPKSHNVSKAIDAAAGAEREVVGEYSDNGRKCPKHQNTHGEWAGDAMVKITAPATPDAVRWDGYGTALKPAHEPVVLARVPLDGTVAHNALTHGCGGLAIDATRVAYASDADREALAKAVELVRAKGGVRDNSWANASDLSGANPASEKGRWPANVLLDEAAAEMLDEQSGELRNGGQNATSAPRARTADGFAMTKGVARPGDIGGASRFFYVAKAGRREREEGTERNRHPTVKPIELTTYVARMLLPPPGPEPRRILVPFCGSGSEVIGCLLAGWDEVVGVELDAEYIDIAKARIAHWLRKPRKSSKPKPAPVRKPVLQQLEMF